MSTLTPGSERRQTERRTLRTTATVVLGETQTFQVRTLDISPGGMGILASASPREGTVFQIRFLIPTLPEGMAPFEARVRVAHSAFSSAESSFKIGLNFVDLPAPSAMAIIQYLG